METVTNDGMWIVVARGEGGATMQGLEINDLFGFQPLELTSLTN